MFQFFGFVKLSQKYLARFKNSLSVFKQKKLDVFDCIKNHIQLDVY